MAGSQVPVIDLGPWRSGGPQARARTAARVDEALRAAGFLLVTGHGVDPSLPARIREAARTFFRLPAALKEPYAVTVGGRGWLGPGAEANSYAEGAASPPDLKESWSFAADEPTGDPAVDTEWYRPNTWPREVPELRAPVTEYLARMRALSDELLELLATALGLAEDHFTRHTGHPTWGFNLNWYPGTEIVGTPCRASSASAPTPTSARSPSSTGSSARAASRSTPTPTAGRTRPTTRPRSPSTSAT